MKEQEAQIENGISEKRKRIGNIALAAGVFALITAGWNFYSWYEATAPYGTLVASAALGIAFLCYVNIKDALRDPAFYLMASADLLALVHLFLIGSDKGAILIVADFLLILYLANKVVFSDKLLLIGAGFTGFFFFYWTVDVKGYFKGYNTNFGGLVLITGFLFTMLLMEYVKDYLKNQKSWKYQKYLWIAQVLLFFLAYKIIAWYRSRCALVGLLVLAILLLIPKKAWSLKPLYYILCAGATIGSIAFTGLYVWLGVLREQFQIQIFYKDILSGREEIWSELWGAYLKQPFTGIGSSYVIQVEWMDGMLEVHNGLLDILIIHGLAVFIAACCFLLYRLFGIRKIAAADPVAKCAMAGIMTMLLTSFLENYVIVPPFSLLFLFLFAIINNRIQKQPDLVGNMQKT